MAVTRLITVQDAPAIAELQRANREFLAPWSPEQPPRYFTIGGQRQVIDEALAAHAYGRVLPHVITCEGAVVGRVTLSDIVRGAFQSCRLGYWVAEPFNGRGLATAAVAELKRLAFEELGLHRIEAGTLCHNARSQAVLERNGFARIGVAPAYLKIDGVWQDHVLHQVLAEAPPESPEATR